jgi:hypothetical protein
MGYIYCLSNWQSAIGNWQLPKPAWIRTRAPRLVFQISPTRCQSGALHFEIIQLTD